jgi:hypothetical protein
MERARWEALQRQLIELGLLPPEASPVDAAFTTRFLGP